MEGKVFEDYSKIKSLKVKLVDLNDLLMKKTNNPLMEQEIPNYLRDLIRNNVDVIVEGEEDVKYKLLLENDEFVMIPFSSS